jgi:RecA-family ATPase
MTTKPENRNPRACPAKELKQKQADDFPKIVSAEEFMATEIPRPPELIKGVLFKGAKGQLGGASKASKTWNLLNLGISVANGIPWLGFDTAQGRVLYINFELSEYDIQCRLKAIAEARNVPYHNIDLWNLRNKRKSLPDLLPELRKQVTGENYSLVIPDPIYKALGNRNENDAGDIGELCAELGDISEETGAAIFWSNHFAKGDASKKNSIDRVSGSGVWARDPDTLIMATTNKTEGSFTIDIICRSFTQPPQFAITWGYPVFYRDDNIDPADIKSTGGAAQVYNVNMILEHLTPGMTTTQWEKVCCEETGMKSRTFYDYRDIALKRNFIIKSGKQWSLK